MAAAVTLILGDDELLLTRAVQESVEEGMDVVRVDPVGLEPGLISALLSPDLFSVRKVVVINTANNLNKAALESIATMRKVLDQDLRLIMTAGTKSAALVKTATSWDANIIRIKKISSPRDRVTFAREEARQQGRRLPDNAAQALIDAVGGDLRSISSAILQLASQTEDVLTEDYVQSFYSGSPETTGFRVADAATTGNTPEALKVLREAFNSGTPNVLIASSLISQLRDMTRARGTGSRSADELAIDLSIPQWKAEKTLRKLNGWSDKGLATAWAAAIKTDGAVKGDAADVKYALEHAVISISGAKRL